MQPLTDGGRAETGPRQVPTSSILRHCVSGSSHCHWRTKPSADSVGISRLATFLPLFLLFFPSSLLPFFPSSLPLLLSSSLPQPRYEPHSKTERPAAEVLAENGLSPLQLGAKEGLALINGTQVINYC